MSQGLTLLRLVPHPYVLHQMDLKESQVQSVEHRLYFRWWWRKQSLIK